MSRKESQLGKYNFDTKFSSGDSKKMALQSQETFKQDIDYNGHYKEDGEYKEENNNEINKLSKDLSAMGCIVEGVKRPPNICVETCVYEESETESDNDNKEEHKYLGNENDEDNYSDEFEEDRSELEAPKSTQSNVEPLSAKDALSPPDSSIKLSKSQSFMSCTKAPGSISGKSSTVSTTSRARRVNMSFSNERLREIERHNHILLNKILSARNTRKSSIPGPRDGARHPVPAAALQRRRQQQQIDHDNMILLKKLQRAKSSSYSVRR